ncbi:hypothetical protein D0Q02_18215 [Micromonospora craniellae]|uniref:Alanine--tRNA ligase n=1 Tax=Micromonospora craniellae TaxID=2294034 RepID=A0A372FWH5_9ACTN|nr:hypothetical protein ID554_02220 [Micromonospora craniellae]RFS45141.1 hypothetical protein D0Q02_18215 [Micromonospora craniellae]
MKTAEIKRRYLAHFEANGHAVVPSAPLPAINDPNLLFLGQQTLDPARVWATVYLDDDEAYGIWRRVGVPVERIVRRGKKDNFWSMGIPGPAGPCSELCYDRGPEYGAEGGPEVDEVRPILDRAAELTGKRVPSDQVADRVEQTVTQLRDAEKELEKLRAQLVLGGAAAFAAQARDVRGVAHVGIEAPEGAAGNDVRTLAQEIRGRIDAARPGVVAVAARANGKASLVVAVNSAARSRGLVANDLVKAAFSGRGGDSPDLAQGGGLPESEVLNLLLTVDKTVAEA